MRPRRGWTATPTPVSTGAAALRLPRRRPGPGTVPVRHLAPAGGGRAARWRELPGRYAVRPALPVCARPSAATSASRGRCSATADDVLVTNGTQHALDLVGRVALEPGDVVAVEEPGYPPAAMLFAAFGVRVAPVPVDEDGLVVAPLPARGRGWSTSRRRTSSRRARRCRWGDASSWSSGRRRMTRSSSRTTTTASSVSRQGRWSRWSTSTPAAGSATSAVLEDHAPAAPARLRRGAAVAAVGASAARQLSDGYGPVPMQAALARFIDEGMLARHVRKASGVYAARHPPSSPPSRRCPATAVPSSAGLHVFARLPAGRPGDGRRVVAAARRLGVAVESLEGYTSTRRARPRRRPGRASRWGTAPWPTTGWTRGSAGWSGRCAGDHRLVDHRARSDGQRPEGVAAVDGEEGHDATKDTTAPRRAHVPRGSSRIAAAVPTT